MPYIPKERRLEIDQHLGPFLDSLDSIVNPIVSVGDLAYIITRIALNSLVKTQVRFGRLATITGMLDLVKHEFERQVVDSYEDEKKRINGDVY